MTYRHLWLQLLMSFGGAALLSMVLAACLTTESSIGARALGSSHRYGEQAGEQAGENAGERISERANGERLASDRNVNPDMDRDMSGLRPADLRIYVRATATRLPTWDDTTDARHHAPAARLQDGVAR